MARPSGRDSRIKALKKLCEGGAIVHIADAAQQLETSEITIRRDLGDGDNGIVCLGGYIMSAEEKGERYSLTHAQSTNIMAKRRIAQEAAKLIEPEDTVFIDAGSTLQHLAPLVPRNANITVVTQAMNIAESIVRLEGVTLLMIAGIYHAESGSFSSETALRMLREINITKGFFSAAGIHENEGVTCFHFHEVAVKKAAIARSQRRFLVSDPTKWGKLRPATFAHLSDFEAWIGRDELTIQRADRL
ncbi:DeoR/GlpR transcriptional regulator [Phyllobacterium salinisoli]|uniref:DeoR/GlpR transcriptional regulator n=1 Tax=Phyllobacterium salinisoli TaxID=1899321 RepID=A0A368JXQ4_9HYPH|nr:DeoR/GlpR family DNA-binding transcription regulator [Phyllobacterium salinisoli]RCS21917.1 DeoR/GlpR transcriptional regulator [Phyllobacterium salinisoli]